MEFTLECEPVDDGRWLAEVPQLCGVLAYGGTREEALVKAEILALRVLAERMEVADAPALPIRIQLASA